MLRLLFLPLFYLHLPFFISFLMLLLHLLSLVFYFVFFFFCGPLFCFVSFFHLYSALSTLSFLDTFLLCLLLSSIFYLHLPFYAPFPLYLLSILFCSCLLLPFLWYHSFLRLFPAFMFCLYLFCALTTSSIFIPILSSSSPCFSPVLRFPLQTSCFVSLLPSSILCFNFLSNFLASSLFCTHLLPLSLLCFAFLFFLHFLRASSFFSLHLLPSSPPPPLAALFHRSRFDRRRQTMISISPVAQGRSPIEIPFDV